VMPLRLMLLARNPDVLRGLADTLDAMGLTVDLASDTASAIHQLAQQPEDVLLLELPDCGDDAIATLRQVRATEGGRQAYCIALIPPEAEAQVARLMLAGAADYLLLNYSEAALLARLNAAQRVVSLQGTVRAERESGARSSGEWARSNRRLLQEALTDPLTRLHNRRYGLDRFKQEWSFAQHSGAPLSCLMLDIDYFKRINDQRGHDVGDVVLAQVARLVEGNCRKNDVVFRYGGEEFCIVSPGTPLAEATLLGERIVTAMRAAHFGRDTDLFPVTLSVGVATRGPATPQVEALISQADKALYAAKESGRDRVMVARGEP